MRVQKMIAVALLLAGSAFCAQAASQEEVNRLVTFIKSSPTMQMDGAVSYVDTIIESDNEATHAMRFQQFRFLTRTLDNKDAFGIRGVYVIGAAESNYTLDTRCLVVFTTFGSGTLDQHRWNCEAWTPTQDAFVDANATRVFDDWVRMALRHVEKRQ